VLEILDAALFIVQVILVLLSFLNSQPKLDDLRRCAETNFAMLYRPTSDDNDVICY